MAITDPPAIAGLYRYPVKGLSAQALNCVSLSPDETIPFDRAWAIENGPGRFRPENPAHLPKINFLMLMRNESLAALESRFDEDTTTLTIVRDGRPVISGDLSQRTGRVLIEQFFATYMAADLRGPPRIVEAPGHSFSDVAARCVHIINLASVRELERATGRPIDPLRFRPNIIIDGPDPFTELSWVGSQLCAGDLRLDVFKRTERCAATNVDPASGLRDMDIPAQLARLFGHTDFGVYARVRSAGTATRGDLVRLEGPKPA